MTPEDILKHDPIILTQEQRELFFEQGFLAVEGLVSDEWLVVERLIVRRPSSVHAPTQYSVHLCTQYTNY